MLYFLYNKRRVKIMLLSKALLNELTEKREINESLQYSPKRDPESYDIFISYNFNDISYAKKIVGLLAKHNYSAYADYQDLTLNRNNVSVKTAKHLLLKMKKCKALFYLHSKSATVSKWCPWEVGIFSGIKNFKCANLPIVDKKYDKLYKHQEYLSLYPYVDYEKNSDDNTYDFWINCQDGKYVSLKEWLNGKQPRFHSN